MPNTRTFLADAAYFPGGRGSLPAGTDMNMFGMFSGSWPGTAGIPYNGGFFKGWDATTGRPVSSIITRDELRYGSQGARALSIFDVVKSPSLGGDPNTFTACISGKFHVDHMFREPSLSTYVDLLVDGVLKPDYLPEPQEYVLGDPVTDPDAATDRDGVRIYPLSEYKKEPYGIGLAGEEYWLHPSDRWIASNALRMLAAEDPDVFAVHLGSVDKIHHAAGAANVPSEWYDPGTPDVPWDDISIYNRNANREPVIDVVYEADACVGLFLNALETRGLKEISNIVMNSDHGGMTYMNEQLNVAALIDAAGLGDAVKRISTYAEIGTVFLNDLSQAGAIESVLENYSIYHPVLEQEVRPFVVITLEEMETGVDSVLGRFGRDGGPSHGELYSEWLIEHPVDDNSKVMWPEMIIYSRYRYQLLNSTSLSKMAGGHSGLPTVPTLLALKGPDFATGIFSAQDASLVDIVPTLYHVLGLTAPGNVDGRVLTEILLEP